MLFNSLEFLLFFPAVLLIYYLSPFRFRWVILLLASYIFYMAWKVEYILLILASTLIDYFCGIRMGKIVTKHKRKPYLYLSLASNLGILFTFKYLNFFTESVNHGLALFGANSQFTLMEILLPVGISFYTFQTMSYSIDVYQGKIQPEHHLGRFALFVSFFPQLVAGPIERAGNILDQFRQKYQANYPMMSMGFKIMLLGFFKKVVVADNIAILVNSVYNNPTEFEGISLILATVLFAFQIYCDFSGYSDIAIGTALILGIKLMQNFRRPYFSKSIGEFWKRWHISLSTWFKDYVYIPLGGNRVVKWRWYYNLLITFLVSGLWHGAAWTFVIWGALHGFYLIMEQVLSKSSANLKDWFGLKPDTLAYKVFHISITFSLVCFAWIFFRANSLFDAFYIISRSFSGLDNLSSILDPVAIGHVLFFDQGIYSFLVAVSAILILLVLELQQSRAGLIRTISKKPLVWRWSFYYSLILLILFFGAFDNQDFIYFQF